MGAARGDVVRFARTYRPLHSHVLLDAFRKWKGYSDAERKALFDTVTSVCATSPVFPFRTTTRLRLLGRRIGLGSAFVGIANFVDRAELGLKYRWRRLCGLFKTKRAR